MFEFASIKIILIFGEWNGHVIKENKASMKFKLINQD